MLTVLDEDVRASHPDTPPQVDVRTLRRPIVVVYSDGTVNLRTDGIGDAIHFCEVVRDAGHTREILDIRFEEDRRELDRS